MADENSGLLNFLPAVAQLAARLLAPAAPAPSTGLPGGEIPPPDRILRDIRDPRYLTEAHAALDTPNAPRPDLPAYLAHLGSLASYALMGRGGIGEPPIPGLPSMGPPQRGLPAYITENRGLWFTPDPKVASRYGSRLSFVDVPEDVARATKGEMARANEHVLPQEWAARARAAADAAQAPASGMVRLYRGEGGIGEPAIPEGFVRLFRGEGARKGGPIWKDPRMNEVAGRWFSSDRAVAEQFVQDANSIDRTGTLLYVDVPKEIAAKATGHPAFDPAPGQPVVGQHLLPPEWATKAVPYPVQPPPYNPYGPSYSGQR